MRDKDIVQAYNNGTSPSAIATEYGISTRQVQRIVKRHRGDTPRPPSKSKDNALRELRAIIVALMQSEGRDFTTCELCGIGIPIGKYDIHHVKYDGATYYDLRIVCRACNTAPVNRYLS